MLYLNARQLFLLWPSTGRFGTTDFFRHRELCHQLCSCSALAWHSQAGSVLLRTTATSPPQHVPVPLDHSWFIRQPDKNKGCSAHNCLQFRHVLYFPSPCIELTTIPVSVWDWTGTVAVRIAKSVLCSYQPGEGRWDPISRNSRKMLQYPKSSLQWFYFVSTTNLFTSALHKQNLLLWSKFKNSATGCLKTQTHKYLDGIFMKTFCIPPPRKSFVPNKGDWNDLKNQSNKKIHLQSPWGLHCLWILSLVYLFILESEAYNRAAKYQLNTAADSSTRSFINCWSNSTQSYSFAMLLT